MKYVFGHKNPDTDSIMSAMVMTEFLKKKGENAKAFRQGNITKEVQYVLDYLGIEGPELLPKLEKGSKIVLVDHNNPTETVENLDELIVTDVVDHHAIKLNTGYPLNFRAEALGCTNTILYKMFKESGFEISKEIATMMLSAIISDSLLFQSMTFTEEDKRVVEELKELVDFDVQEYGLNLLKAGTDISDLSAKEVINLDAKTKSDFGVEIKIAQVNTADVDEVLKREEELKEAINEEIESENFHLFILLITDIVNANSMSIILGERIDIVKEAFNIDIEDDKALLEGVLSRKKQVIPPIEEVLRK